MSISQKMQDDSSCMLESVKPFHDQGFAIHLLHAKQKRPIGDGWAAKPRASWPDLQAGWRDGLNIGLRLGAWSKVCDLYLYVIDMDIRDPERAAQAHAALDAALPAWRTMPTVISGSGGESRHVYFLTDEQFSSSVFAHSEDKFADAKGKKHYFWELELFGTGKQVAFPGSIHPDTGLPYVWEREFDFDDMDMGIVPYVSSDVVRAWARVRPDEGPANDDEDDNWLMREAKKRDVSIEAARATLSLFPADWWEPRAQWSMAGMALHYQFDASGEAFELWCEMSKQSTKFNLKEHQQQWRSFKPTAKPITWGSIVDASKAFRDADSDDDSDEEIPTADRNPGGDYAQSRRFVAKYRGRMRFNRAEQVCMHYVDSAGAWRRCERGEAEQAMQASAVAAFDAACAAFRSDPGDAYNKHLQSEAASYLKNTNLLHRALLMAKSHPRFVCLPTDFNTDPYAFPVSNGLIDLRSGKLTPPSPELMISKLSAITFDPTATCPMFDDFMRTVMPDAEVRRFLQLAVGYTLTGLVDDEKIFLCYGVGRNGKSVLANIIEALLGEFSVTVSPELFTKSGSNSEGERQITSLIGRRLCLANEAAQASVWRDDRLKMLASRETIQGRFLYKETVTFFPTHKIWFRSNHLPGSHDGSDGFWRRLVAIPFSVQIPEAEVIGDLDRQIIRTELPGVLNWALAGAKAYLAAGRLIVPSVLTRITAQYRDSCDLLGQWLDMYVDAAPGERLPSGTAYQAYRDFCRDEGVTPPPQLTFSKSMGERGHPPTRTKKLRFFNNLKMRCDFDDDDIG